MCGLRARINYKISSIFNYFSLFILLVVVSLYIMTIYHANPINISVLHFLSMDYFFWIVYIPVICIINRCDLINKNYFEISRINSKYKRFYLNILSIVVTSIVINCFIFSVSFLIELLIRHKFMSTISLFMYLLIRYCLLGILIQFSVYILVNIFMKYKLKNVFSFIPIIIFLIYIFPYEMFSGLLGLVIPIIDFTAGGLYDSVGNNVLFWDLFLGNLNIVGFLIVLFLLYKWFYLEREEYPNYEI